MSYIYDTMTLPLLNTPLKDIFHTLTYNYCFYFCNSHFFYFWSTFLHSCLASPVSAV